MAYRIIKGLDGLYTVMDEKMNTSACKARGIFRRQKITPLTGDIVELDVNREVIDKIYPRKNSLSRPPVANIDVMFIVVATAEPTPSPFITDKLIAVCEENNIEPVLCFNKTDIKNSDELMSYYNKSGIKIIETCASNSDGSNKLSEIISEKVCVFGGNSGVGKSSLIRTLGIDAQVGSISKKNDRGRHTTKHVELYPVCNGFIADTPGFGDIDYATCLKAKKDDVQYLFREFESYIGKCRFTDCAHINEPDCAVKRAVGSGDISTSRYESYKAIYAESKALKEYK